MKKKTKIPKCRIIERRSRVKEGVLDWKVWFRENVS
jgi:hypothetical protein